MIDRIIVAAESGGIESKIIINKSDLESNDEIEYWKKLYEQIGYQVFVTSVITNSGFDSVREAVNNKVSCFWGQSGAGKSSILNLLFPGLDLKVGKISEYSSKGKHTTVTVQMLKIGDKAFVIDTPGIREIEPYGLMEEDLGHYFAEIKERLISCKFNSCTHNHEPGCAILEALDKGEISEERYISYLNILSSIESDIRF
jgi:ribosome biogenesis GTPase